MAIADKLTYLDDTKQLIRAGLESVGEYITDDTPFREYVTKLANSQRTLGSNFAGDSYDLLSPVNDLDFEGVYTLTRGSDGTFWNRHGILSTAGMDVKRVNHDPATLNSSADTFDLATLSRWDVVVVNLGSANTYSEGQVVAVSDDADLNNCFYAEIKSIDTDALTCHVTHVQGTGSISAWTIIKSEGLLIEEQRTNLLLWSEDFDDAAWTKAGSATITTDAIASPDGTTSADLYQENEQGSFVRSTLTLSVGTAVTYTLFLSKQGHDWQRLFIAKASDPANTFARLWVNLGTGELGSDTQAGDLSIIETSVSSAGGGFFRVSLSVNILANDDYWIAFTTADNDLSLTRVLDSDVALWGAQLEQGSFPTSYIKTEASQVTRSADNCSRTLGSEFNASEGNLTVTAKAEVGDIVAALGTESIVADVDIEKEYTLNYNIDPSATAVEIMPSANGYIKSLRYIPREVV